MKCFENKNPEILTATQFFTRTGENSAPLPLAESDVEKVAGSICGGFLDHVIVINKGHLHGILEVKIHLG